MEHGREGDYEGKERKKRKVLRCEGKQFWDRDRGLKESETDKWVRFVIVVMVSSLLDA